MNLTVNLRSVLHLNDECKGAIKSWHFDVEVPEVTNLDVDPAPPVFDDVYKTIQDQEEKYGILDAYCDDHTLEWESYEMDDLYMEETAVCLFGIFVKHGYSPTVVQLKLETQ